MYEYHDLVSTENTEYLRDSFWKILFRRSISKCPRNPQKPTLIERKLSSKGSLSAARFVYFYHGGSDENMLNLDDTSRKRKTSTRLHGGPFAVRDSYQKNLTHGL
jgi:hypothetical protein